jgi:hypothetical protein
MQHGLGGDKPERASDRGFGTRTVTDMTSTPDQPVGYAPAAQTAPLPGNGGPSGLAKGSFIAAIVLIALSAVRQVDTSLVPVFSREMNYSLFSLVQGGLNVLFGVLALAVLTIGIVALVTRREPRWAAGVAVGASASIVIGVLAGFLTSALFGLLG